MTAITPRARWPLSMLSAANHQGASRRPVQLQHPLLVSARRRCGEELLDGLGGERVAMPASDEGDGFAVPEHGFAAVVGYEHRLGKGVECPAEPDGLGARFCDGFGSTVGPALQEDEHFLEVVCVLLGRVGAKPAKRAPAVAVATRFDPGELRSAPSP